MKKQRGPRIFSWGKAKLSEHGDKGTKSVVNKRLNRLNNHNKDDHDQMQKLDLYKTINIL